MTPRVLALLAVPLLLSTAQSPPRRPAPLTIDYPATGSVFPPEFPPPVFLWRDATPGATSWRVDVRFEDGGAAVTAVSKGERMKIGEIDPRAVAATNRPPVLTPQQAAARTWTPEAESWAEIKRRSVSGAAIVSITGMTAGKAVSRGEVTIRTSADPVGAPIFYRDVPLMPSETEKGVIKPLSPKAVPLIAWRLRDVGETRSRVLMEGIHSCANCHSFSRDGKTMGMDVDGPQNDKGLYALTPVERQMTIRNENVVAWSTFQGKLGGKLRVGFMSQVSPDGQHVVTTINDPGEPQTNYQRKKYPQDLIQNYYVSNFKDYRFLQVFFPTRGILAWYNKSTGKLQPLPGADDPRYVHTNAVWSPDGKWLVFARAEAKDAYPPGTKPALHANDPNETQVRYDLYRIPFNDGRGGTPVAIAGASANGMSNSFPKISPDGKWIVFVQARNGQLMRPDGKLYIAPAEGGKARLMNCNTPLMNSWHSFSPNGRWMVFSSKSRSPYTQMFLTHVDENGNDTPAILIDNATAANRAVNIPEFVNVAPGGIERIDAPVTDYYRVVDTASEMMKAGKHAESIAEWRKAIELSPGEALPYNNLGFALAETGKLDEAVRAFEKALELNPEYPEAHNNLGEALARKEMPLMARSHFERALKLNPEYASAHSNLGSILMRQGEPAEAIPHLQRAIEAKPESAEAHNNLGLALAMMGLVKEAIPILEEAVKLSHGKDALMLDLLGGIYAQAGRKADAIRTGQRALAVATEQGNQGLAEAIRRRIQSYGSAM